MAPDNAGEGAGDQVRRWIAQQLQRSLRELESLDVDTVARLTGWTPEQAQERLDLAGTWLSSRADELSEDALRRFEQLADLDALKRLGGIVSPETLQRLTGLFNAATGGSAASGTAAPHPLDVPSSAQGLALSAIDSGRWSVAPGSHEFTTHSGEPAPEHASALIGELRARDWIDSDGQVTQVGRRAIDRWMNETTNG